MEDLVKSKDTKQLHWIFNVPFNTTIYIVLAIVYSVAPAALMIANFRPDIFLKLDFSKLLLVILSAGTLIYALNYLIIYMSILLLAQLIKHYTKTPTPDTKTLKVNIYFSSALVVNVFYTFTILVQLIIFMATDKTMAKYEIIKMLELLILSFPFSVVIGIIIHNAYIRFTPND